MKNTKDLIAKAYAVNQQQLNAPSKHVLADQVKKYEKLRIKKERAERTAVKKIEGLLTKNISAEKPLNRPQYIAVRTLGYISHPIVEPLFSMSVVVSSFLMTDNALNGLGLSVMTMASLYTLSNKFLPRLMTRAQAVNNVIPLLENLATSHSSDVQKCVEQLAKKLNDPNLSSTFWNRCFEILTPANTAVCRFDEQTKAVECFVAIEEQERKNPMVFATDPKRMKL